ncbi:Uncharacterised protein [Mycobacterium tuberculosis]|nr:Uncharacterised protein [Mycobacterium tuberculosis]
MATTSARVGDPDSPSGGATTPAAGADVTSARLAAEAGLTFDAVHQPRPVRDVQSLRAIGLLKRTHQRLHCSLPRLHGLLGKLREWAHDAADRAAERAGNARHRLLHHLRRPLGLRLSAHPLELLGRIGLIRRELLHGIGRMRPPI